MAARLGQTKQRRNAGDVRQRGERDDTLRRPRIELQRRRRDDAERALRADEQIAQVVAGVVLLQRAQAVPHLAVRRHHLEAERQRARVAVGEHADAAGVGRQHAADLAAPLRRQAERKQAIGAVGSGLRVGQGHAGLDDHGAARRIDIAHARQPRQRQHHLAPVGRGRLAADEAGVAALGDDADACLVGDGKDLRDLVGRARAQHQRGAPFVQPAQLMQERLLAIAVGNGVRRPDDVDQARQRPFAQLRSCARRLPNCRPARHAPALLGSDGHSVAGKRRNLQIAAATQRTRRRAVKR